MTVTRRELRLIGGRPVWVEYQARVTVQEAELAERIREAARMVRMARGQED